ncbi:MAG: triose-phosphate isomerase [Patescibacteria group bacterium]
MTKPRKKKSKFVKPQPQIPLIVGNWKMNLDLRTSVKLARGLANTVDTYSKKCQIVVAPTFTALDQVGKEIKNSNIELCSQDVFWEAKGNFTGEVSPEQLRDLGCDWTIIGHSERRQHLGETDDMIDRKTTAALRHGFTPIICVGETREQRNAGSGELTVAYQVRSALRYVGTPLLKQKVIIAYEPVWSISPGLPCEPEDAEAMAMVIRQALIDQYEARMAYQHFSIIYGGSVSHSNVSDYLAKDEIVGALVGHDSLEVASFTKLIQVASRSKLIV